MDKTGKYENIDEYIALFPKSTQEILEKIRAIISKASPKAAETISYGIPTFKLNGKFLIYFAGFKNHVSLYPIPDGPESFKKDIEKYIAGKGTIKFPLDKEIPYELIKEIVGFAIETNKKRTKDYKAW